MDGLPILTNPNVRLVIKAIACVVLMSWTAHPAVADAEVEDRAPALFGLAETAFRNGEYDRCVELLREAFDVRPHDQLHLNIARCLEAGERLGEAHAEYELAIQSPLPESVVRRARSRQAALRPRLLHLVVSSDGDDIAVHRDGLEVCRTPCEVWTDPGAQVLTLLFPQGPRRIRVEGEAGATVPVHGSDLAQAPGEEEVPIVVTPTRGSRILLWSGVVLVGAATAAAIGAGVRTRRLHSDYVAEPTQDRRSQGERTTRIRNVGLGIVGVGGAMVVVSFTLR
ncbi:MAG: tetratricopeptide repeat protein [Polyangiales bacterium]